MTPGTRPSRRAARVAPLLPALRADAFSEMTFAIAKLPTSWKFKRSRRAPIQSERMPPRRRLAPRARLYRRSPANRTPAGFTSKRVTRAGIEPAEAGIILKEGAVHVSPGIPQQSRPNNNRHLDIVGDVDHGRGRRRGRIGAERRDDHLRRIMNAHARGVDDLSLARPLGKRRRGD